MRRREAFEAIVKPTALAHPHGHQFCWLDLLRVYLQYTCRT